MVTRIAISQFLSSRLSSIRCGPQALNSSSLRKAFSSPSVLKMRIVPVPVRTDNYAYLLIDDDSRSAAVVDPYDPGKVMQAAKDQNVSLSGTILTTHHHHDHSGGNEALVSELSRAGTIPKDAIRVYGGSTQIASLTDKVQDNTTLELFGGAITVRCLATPCHTQDSICYYVQDAKDVCLRGVFTGDTLFVAGCGRFFEGTAAQMDHALNTKLAGLPPDTITYVGHEYTKSNVAFAKSIEPTNTALITLSKACENNLVTTGKYTIGDEKNCNPFMRLNEPEVIKATGNTPSPDPHQVMQRLREMKNSFKG